LFARVPPVPPPLPAWLTEADVDYYTSEFTRTGFRGGLNWYRNIDRNWELLAPFEGVPISVPALYIAGERDPVIKFPGMDCHIADLPKWVPQLRGLIMLPCCGYRPGGAAGRGQRCNDRLHPVSALNKRIACMRNPQMANQLPPRLIEMVNKLIRTSRQMMIEMGREPTTKKLAERLLMPHEKVAKLLDIARRPVRIDAR